MNSNFLKDTFKGLSLSPKKLFSKYFYDAKGDKLFVDIMHLPEYYLTRSELEIFQIQKQDIIKSFGMYKYTEFDLIELGAGDGTKTRELIEELISEDYKFNYLPIDISKHALDDLELKMKKEFNTLSLQQKQGDYFFILVELKQLKKPKVVLFLGSNLGNMQDAEAKLFLTALHQSLNPNDILFLGTDLIKSKEIVLPAYSDSQGVTAEFNLNLLDRMNKELGANFDRNQFEHLAEYSEETGLAESFLVSKRNQKVQIYNKEFSFTEGEKINTEVSRKYSKSILQRLIQGTSFMIENEFIDSKNYFCNFLIKKK